MTDPEVFIFGSFTEDEILSLQRRPMKNDLEITFGSLDAETLRSVGLLKSPQIKVGSSQAFHPPKDKENSISTPGSNEKASTTVSFLQENGSTDSTVLDYQNRSTGSTVLDYQNGSTGGGTVLDYHSTVQDVKPCYKEHPFLGSEGSSFTPIGSSVNQDLTEVITNRSISSDGFANELPRHFRVRNHRGNAWEASNGPAKTIEHLLPRGLVNLGNLCFLNASLQALLSCTPFVQLLRELRTRDIPENGYPTLRAFVEFISDFDMPLNSTLKRKESTFMETGRPFQPLMFESVLKCFTPDVPNSLTGRPRQEDAQEFLSFIMHQMHDELLKLDSQLPNGVDSNSSLVSSIHVDDEENWETVGPRNRTAITRTQSFVPSKLSAIFGGQLKSVVKAKGIKTSATIQPYLLLHLNICPDPVCTIEDALRLFSAPETIEGYRSADGRSEVVSASKSVKILELSDVVIMHLMRFTYGSEGSTKLHKPIHFPLEFAFGRDLLFSPQYEGRRYELVATITHHGLDPFKGHYTADARHANGRWLRYDDAAVTPIPISKVLHEQSYILFYKQM